LLVSAGEADFFSDFALDSDMAFDSGLPVAVVLIISPLFFLCNVVSAATIRELLKPYAAACRNAGNWPLLAV
jgi:hypothetical protein